MEYYFALKTTTIAWHVCAGPSCIRPNFSQLIYYWGFLRTSTKMEQHPGPNPTFKQTLSKNLHLLSAAEGQRPRNYSSCCCCSWIFCLIYALSTSTTVLPPIFLSIYPSIHLAVFLSVNLSIDLFHSLKINI